MNTFIAAAVIAVVSFAHGSSNNYCIWKSSDINSCTFLNATHTNSSQPFAFDVIGYNGSDGDNSVTIVSTDDNSVFNFVPMEILERFINLEVLWFRGSHLEEIDKPLSSCKKLLLIDLTANNLTSVGRVFDECKKLIVINFSHNKIASIDGNILKELSNLDSFQINANLIEDIPEGLFDENKKLTIIDISSNLLKEQPRINLENVPSLKTLKINYNCFTEISRLFTSRSMLEDLQMESNKIVEVQDEIFSGLVELDTLNLSRNLITFLHPRCFRNLKKLRHVNLSYNQIVNIDPEVFKSLVNIWDIMIHNNQIEDFAAGTFVGLTKMESLAISDNKLTQLRMSSFGELPLLSVFYIDNNPLNIMSHKFFENFQSLRYLLALNASCINNNFLNFQSVSMREFSRCFKPVINCVYSVSDHGNACEINQVDIDPHDEVAMIDGNYQLDDIRYVNASKAVLDFIPQIIFDVFKNLTRLELNEVGLMAIRKLDNCQSLTYLSLEDNEILQLNNAIFEKCSNLKEIYLSGNGIESFGAFKGLHKLEILHIENSKDKLADIQSTHFFHSSYFVDNQELTELHFSLQKNVLFFGKDHWINTPKLQTLKLENNGKLEYGELENPILRPLPNVESLSLAGNEISSIKEFVFASLVSLKALNLSHNHLSSLPENLFASTTNLTTLIMDHNNFTELPAALHRLENLRELSVASNKLKTLANTLEIPSLRILSLINNAIASISFVVFDLTTNLVTLELFGNVCSQDNFNMISNLTSQVYPRLSNCFNNFEPCVFTETKFGYSCKLIMGPGSSEGAIRTHLDNHSDEDVKYLQLKFMPLELDLDMIIERFSSVEKVELWRNSIEELSPLTNCSNLITFDARQNQLKILVERIFSDCSKIEKWILVKNEITEISAEAFEGLVDLQHLDLSFNELESFPGSSLKPMTKLKVLKLSHNKLQSYDWVSDLKSLRTLDLSHNELNSVNIEAFWGQTELKELHLNNNKITQVHTALSSVLLKLVYLNLADNDLKELHLSHRLIASLQFMDVSNNKINFIGDDLRNYKHLTNFYDTNNCMNESLEELQSLDDETWAEVQTCSFK